MTMARWAFLSLFLVLLATMAVMTHSVLAPVAIGAVAVLAIYLQSKEGGIK